MYTMKVYFLSAQPCILTLNGAYFGKTDTFERFIEVSAKDNVYAKFSPQNAGDIGFFIKIGRASCRERVSLCV